MSHELEYHSLTNIFQRNHQSTTPLTIQSPRHSDTVYTLPPSLDMALLYDTMELPLRIP
jgi:hypothetical protein